MVIRGDPWRSMVPDGAVPSGIVQFSAENPDTGSRWRQNGSVQSPTICRDSAILIMNRVLPNHQTASPAKRIDDERVPISRLSSATR